MAKREYKQVLRAEAVEEVRRRILDAVARRLREAPTKQLSLDEVASLARVSRSTVYAGFGSRAGLFEAFVRDLSERSGRALLQEAVSSPDARDHLRNGFRAASRMMAKDLEVLRVLHAMDRLDPASVGGAVRQKEENRHAAMKYVAQRLSEDGVLREGVSVEQAVDVMWLLASFESLDLLVTGRHLSVEAATELLIELAERTLCEPMSETSNAIHP